MAKKQFKAESKRLLDLMINSIYTNREIFLRELISNASDALDKRYFYSLSNEDVETNKDQLFIRLETDQEAKTLKIIDTGIGMSKEDLINNLGTIARSGSLEFKKQLEEGKDNVDIIGQFGVGFYSAFMVAKKIEVETRNANEETGYLWVSEGEDGYSISEVERQEIGTTITLHLKDDTETTNYSDYLNDYTLNSLIKKYSDYVRYPIKMMQETSVPKKDNDQEMETVLEDKTLNTMVPLWKKQKSEITTEQYHDFYKAKFADFKDPQEVIHYNIEGNISYQALLFIPSQAPYNFYSNDYEKGLQLYSKGVFIMDNAKDLIPDYFRFVKGLVDSNDLNLNISREILQQDQQVTQLAKSVEKKIKRTLETMLKNKREDYEKFFDNFGMNLKYGIYQDYGMHKDTLQDLILFKSSKEDKYVTLKEYVERMNEDQDLIYYACGKDLASIKKLPVMEKLKDKEIEVLYFTDDVDEFAISIMQQYQEKKFKSVNQGDLDLDTKEEKEALQKQNEENSSLLETLKTSLNEQVKEVRLSSRLKTHPVCLVSDEGISMEMEKVLAQAPNGNNLKATKILEINPNHEIFKTLQKLHDNHQDIDKYAHVLYNQALLIEGFTIEDPIKYANDVCDLMIEANK